MRNSNNRQSLSVAMYISSFWPRPMGGMEMQGLRLAQCLSKQGIEVTIITHGYKGCKKKEVHEGIQVIRLYSWMNACFDFAQKIKGKIKSGKSVAKKEPAYVPGQLPYKTNDTAIKINGGFIDLVYYVIQGANFLWHQKAGKTKYRIIHVHGVPWVSFVGAIVARFSGVPLLVKESTTTGLQKFDDIIMGRKMRNAVLKQAHFVAISRYIYQTMLEEYKIPAHRVHYIPNGVALPDHQAEETFDKLNVLFVGNLTQGASKGLDVLLQAWQIVIRQFPAANLLIAGNNENMDRWLNHLTYLGIQGNVRLLGATNKLDDIYSMTSIFVSPSRREGLSNALLEAMANSLPCVVTNISGSQDMIVNGLNGYVVEPGNSGELAEALIRLLSSKASRQRMRQLAYAKVKESCSLENITAAYAEIYSLLLKKALS